MAKKKVEKLTPAQRKARRHNKRKAGPSALKRKERRVRLQPKPVEEVVTEVTEVKEV